MGDTFASCSQCLFGAHAVCTRTLGGYCECPCVMGADRTVNEGDRELWVCPSCGGAARQAYLHCCAHEDTTPYSDLRPVPPGHHVVPDGHVWIDGRVCSLVKIPGAGWSLRGITIATSQEERSPRTDPVYRLVPVDQDGNQ